MRHGLRAGGRIKANPVDMDRFGDVLHRLAAKIVERDIEAAADIIMHARRNANPARIVHRLDTRGDVDPVAEDILALDDDVADVDAETEEYPLIVRQPGITLRDAALNIHGVRHGVDGTGELDQRAITRRLYDVAAMPGDLRMKKLRAEGIEARQGACLVLSHHLGIADDVG